MVTGNYLTNYVYLLTNAANQPMLTPSVRMILFFIYLLLVMGAEIYRS
jgi:uncharacterized membrane protein (DUF106 family)